MRLSRRSLLRWVVAAAAAPFLPLRAPRVVEWAGNPFPDGTFAGPVGGINRATFHFWRNQQAGHPQNLDAFAADMRNVYDECR